MAGEDDRLGEGTDEQQGHLYSKSGFFRRPLPREAVESLVENLAGGRIAGQSRELDFTPWGGAYNRVPAGATAFAHREELFLIQHAVVTGPDASAAGTEEARRWLGRSWDLVRPWGSGACTRTGPTPTSRTGRSPTMVPTSPAWYAQRESTTPKASSASTSRSRIEYPREAHRRTMDSKRQAVRPQIRSETPPRPATATPRRPRHYDDPSAVLLAEGDQEAQGAGRGHSQQDASLSTTTTSCGRPYAQAST
jgi:hypothetical protein